MNFASHKTILFLFCTFVGVLMGAGKAFSDASVSEFSLGVGWAQSNIFRPGKNQYLGETSFSFGGPSGTVGATVYQTSRVVARLSGNVVLDWRDSAVLRYGASAGLGYHLLGGPVSKVQRSENWAVTSSYPYCLTAVIQPAFNAYAFPDSAGDTAHPLKSSILEAFAGLEYTHSFLFDTSIGFMILASLRSFYISGDLISTQSFEGVASWRTAL